MRRGAGVLAEPWVAPLRARGKQALGSYRRSVVSGQWMLGLAALCM